ncbi:MAG: DUF4080 domain-containing protein [Candidatus Ozemobacteraceae bacterium]
MTQVVLAAINTRHTHSSLSLACLQSFWNRIPGRTPIVHLDFDMNRGTEALIQELILLRPRFLGFSVYIWSLISTLAVSGAVKAALPDTRIIFGGPEVSFDTERLMKENPWIDGIVRGEGEETFEMILERFLKNESWDGIEGFTHRKGGEIVVEPERPVLRNLDALPSPFLDGMYGTGQGFTYYEASRGCPYRCTYCLSSVLGPVRHFSLERVKKDLDWFMKSDFTQVRFADRTFNQDIERAGAVVQHILENNTRQVAFHFELKADLLTDEFIDLLGKGAPGLFHLEIGVQSTYEPALDAVGRKTDLVKLAERIQALRERTGCHIHLDLLAGLPGEDFARFKQTLNDAHAWQPSSIQVGLVKVLKGTALCRHVERGELFCAPYPPYAVQRSKWLTAEEVIRCVDIAKMVEGIGNAGRFSRTLQFLSRGIFSGNWAEMYQALAAFWRESGKTFHSFGPEVVRDGLSSFIGSLRLSAENDARSRALILHEYRLNQKVPSGKLGPQPQTPSLGDKPLDKRRSGLKPFWYFGDPLEMEVSDFQRLSEHPASCLATPVIYSYQTDLSLPPETQVLNLPLVERFVLALLDQVSSLAMLVEAWKNTGRTECPEAAFKDALDKLRAAGLLYQPRTRSS